jgi:hypothetical protein
MLSAAMAAAEAVDRFGMSGRGVFVFMAGK